MEKEYVESIFYRKITKAEFNAMYKLYKPGGDTSDGGGQSYIDCSGINKDRLKRFFKYGEMFSTGKGKHNAYQLNTYVLGQDVYENLIFQPRTEGGRVRNYTIRLQQLEKRHPAWKEENEFPAPDILENGEFDKQKDYTEKYENLFIFIIRTTYKRYYASFVNEANLPEEWPHEDDLLKILRWEPAKQDKNSENGVIIFEDSKYEFLNDKNKPFLLISDDNRILYDIIKEQEQIEEDDNSTFDFERMTYTEVEPPNMNLPKAKKVNSVIETGVKTDYEKLNKIRTSRGDLGEEIVINIEKKKLCDAGRKDLADQVKWVAKVSERYGYDIESFELNSSGDWDKIFIEVKTTVGGIDTPFPISEHELEVSDQTDKKNKYYIYRVFKINIKKSSFEIYKISGDIRKSLHLKPMNYMATLHQS